MACSSVLPQRLLGKVALITGGASGIGAATAKLYAKHGAKVIIADIQTDLGYSIEREIGKDSASFVYCDVTDESSVRDAVDLAITKHGKLDIFFSNVGILGKPVSSILEIDHDIVESVYNVNVFGTFYCAKHAARVMIPAKKGCILLNASIATGTVIGGMPHTYLTSKHAIVGLTKSLCVELGQHGIRVNCVSPYAVATPGGLSAIGMVDREKAEDIFKDASNLKGVVAEEDDIANAALYLGSDESKYVSGVNLLVDGGYSTTNKAFTDAFSKLFA